MRSCNGRRLRVPTAGFHTRFVLEEPTKWTVILDERATMAKKISQSPLLVVLPGDNVTKHVLSPLPLGDTKLQQQPPKLGPGLRYDDSKNQVFATLAGRLVTAQSGTSTVHFVRQNTRRYRPVLQDRCLGIVQERIRGGQDVATGGDLFYVNIGAAHPAILSNLAFEGATKRNRPTLQPGQVFYARVVSLMTQSLQLPSEDDNNLEPLSLSCKLGPQDVGLPRKDWMTAEGVYGELRGGTICRISTGLARELLHPDNLVLSELAAAKLAFEVAVGVNGFLWIHSGLPEHTILIQNAILNSQVLSEEQVRGMVKSLVFTVEKQLQQDRDAMEE
jgi:exosome complex component RRP40